MMKFAVLIVSLMFVSNSFASESCASIKKSLKADLKALGAYLETSPVEFKTKSDEPKEMVKQYILKTNGDDSNYEYKWYAKSIGSDESVAGTTTRAAALSAIMGTAETWYSESTEGDLKDIRAAARKVMDHKEFIVGYEDGAQGWGGSPAMNLLFLLPECKVAYVFFLGISHD